MTDLSFNTMFDGSIKYKILVNNINNNNDKLLNLIMFYDTNNKVRIKVSWHSITLSTLILKKMGVVTIALTILLSIVRAKQFVGLSSLIVSIENVNAMFVSWTGMESIIAISFFLVGDDPHPPPHKHCDQLMSNADSPSSPSPSILLTLLGLWFVTVFLPTNYCTRLSRLQLYGFILCSSFLTFIFFCFNFFGTPHFCFHPMVGSCPIGEPIFPYCSYCPIVDCWARLIIYLFCAR